MPGLEPLASALAERTRALRRALRPRVGAPFADELAQLAVCALFAAHRCRAGTAAPGSLAQAFGGLPAADRRLRSLLRLLGSDELPDGAIAELDRAAELVAGPLGAEAAAAAGVADPLPALYEPLLAAYAPERKASRGVFFTPPEVAAFMVRAADACLREQLGLDDGLADGATWADLQGRHPGMELPEGVSADDPFVRIVEPAAGAGAFLLAAVDLIHRRLRARWGAEGAGEAEARARWRRWVPRHLLPRIGGVELLLAPWAIGHLRLGLWLRDTGYHLGATDRIALVHGDALADGGARLRTMAPTVVLANPPWAKASANRSAAAEALVRRYKAPLAGERNLQPLSDDYLKFLGAIQDAVRRLPAAVACVVSNRGLLGGLIHRGVRRALLDDFARVDVCDLRGDADAGDGRGRGNVFPIRQGAAITMLARAPGLPPLRRLVTLEGGRAEKLALLGAAAPDTLPWQQLAPEAPQLFLDRRRPAAPPELAGFHGLDEVFGVRAAGIKTHRDALVIGFERAELERRIEALLAAPPPPGLEAALEQVRADSARSGRFRRLLYRPFDERWLFYHPALLDRAREATMGHMLGEPPNLALAAVRQVPSGPFTHVLATRALAEMKSVSHDRGSTLFPLYLRDARGALSPNLRPAYLEELAGSTGLAYRPEGQSDPARNFGPEDVLAFIYALLHSSSYRGRYADALRIAFAPVPGRVDAATFRALVPLGRRLLGLHLGEARAEGAPDLRLVSAEPNPRVAPGHPRYRAGRLSIAPGAVIEGVEAAVWQARLGGHRVLPKWLRARRGRSLTATDLARLRTICGCLEATPALGAEVDEVVAEKGGWSLVFSS